MHAKGEQSIAGERTDEDLDSFRKDGLKVKGNTKRESLTEDFVAVAKGSQHLFWHDKYQAVAQRHKSSEQPQKKNRVSNR